MIAFLIILVILFFLSLIFFILCLSNIEIEINKLLIDTKGKRNEKIKDYLFYIRLKLLGKITLLKIKIDNDKINKVKKSKVLNSKLFKKLSELNIKDIKLVDKSKIIESIKELNIRVNKLDLYFAISISDNILTSFAVVILATLISVIVAKNIKNGSNKDEYMYEIKPIYEYKPRLKIKLNCIIDVKIVHIINVIYMLIKKRSVKYDERTSNRRTYVCSNE